MRSFDEVDDMLLSEYYLLMETHSLKELDRQRDIYLQAYANARANDTETKGKKTVPVYKTFKSFFDYEAKKIEILGYDNIRDDDVRDNMVNKRDKNDKIRYLVLKANKEGG